MLIKKTSHFHHCYHLYIYSADSSGFIPLILTDLCHHCESLCCVQLLQLAHLLRVPAVDKQDRHGQVLLLLAKAALCNNDVSTGYSYCHQLVLSGYGAACSVCIDLAEKEALTDTSAK